MVVDEDVCGRVWRVAVGIQLLRPAAGEAEATNGEGCATSCPSWICASSIKSLEQINVVNETELVSFAVIVFMPSV